MHILVDYHVHHTSIVQRGSCVLALILNQLFYVDPGHYHEGLLTCLRDRAVLQCASMTNFQLWKILMECAELCHPHPARLWPLAEEAILRLAKLDLKTPSQWWPSWVHEASFIARVLRALCLLQVGIQPVTWSFSFIRLGRPVPSCIKRELCAQAYVWIGILPLHSFLLCLMWTRTSMLMYHPCSI